ncbi:hypothetical protein NPIL_248941 [Nephila pilipes]|uniref:Uncharacterized protein n=1 Tax=Nephila pilipes TaxID=299642 RepID=A0A8X6QLA4_NEPPI|nr:hypothetical protein NPIL_248941 [Nephila pilipes]
MEHFDTTILRFANTFEKFENEYQTMANDRMSEYQVHQTSPKYSSPIEDSDTKVLEIDKRNHFPLYQGYISEEIPNLLVKCCDSSEGSSELKRENLHEGLVTLSAVGRCIRIACDTLLGMDPCNTDHLLENTDSQFIDFISFDSKQQASFSEVEMLGGNMENKSEITSEKLESEKYQFKQDSSLSRSMRNKSSEISTETFHFNNRIYKYGMCEKKIFENQMSSINSKCVFQKNLKGNIGYFDTTSLGCANAFEKFENEYQKMENDRMSEYQVLQTIPKYCSRIEDSDTEVLEMDKRNHFPLYQGYISEEIPNSIVKCCDSSEESFDIKQENLHEGLVTLSAVGRCIRNACDSLLGMDPCNTDYLLKTTDSQFMDLISSDSKQQASFSEVKLLEGNAENKSEITREKLESEKYQFKQDSSPSRALCNKSSEISTEEHIFNPGINKYGMYEQMFLDNDYQPSFTGKKAFQCDVEEGEGFLNNSEDTKESKP